MIISKCVPLSISRKRFSDFLECERLEDAQTLYLVGYDELEGVKKNKKLKFSDVKSYVDLIEDSCKEQTNEVKVDLEYKIHQLQKAVAELKGEDWDDDSQWGDSLNEVVFFKAIYNEDEKTARINLKRTLGCVEINGGGAYDKEYVIFDNPIIGVTTRVIIDNSGRINPETGEFEAAINDFYFYYGINDYDANDGTPLFNQIACVPVNYTCIVEILHTTTTDIIINTSYSPTKFVEDAQAAYEYVDDRHAFNLISPEDNTLTSQEIDLEDERAYIEFECAEGCGEYTFWFSNPELGSMTYIVVSNPTENTVEILYAKRVVDESGIPVTKIESGERAVIQIFHSLSSDIVAKVTIVNM